MSAAISSEMLCTTEVKFHELARDPSVEAAAERWVERLEEMTDIEHAAITIERTGRSRTTVHVTLATARGGAMLAVATRPDAYVAVSDAFRELRRQLIQSPESLRAIRGRGACEFSAPAADF